MIVGSLPSQSYKLAMLPWTWVIQSSDNWEVCQM